MDTVIRLCALSLLSQLLGAEPLEAMQQKRDAYMAYGGDHVGGGMQYEPMAFAAVSLHPPVPVLHIISPHPMAAPAPRPDPRPAPTRPHSSILYARPDGYGGYTYYSKTKRSPNKPSHKPNRPVILRIHKYRIVRDR